MKISLLILALFFVGNSNAQPELDSWILNTDGTQAGYWYAMGGPPTWIPMTDSAFVLDVCYTADSVWVSGNGLPDTMGLFFTPNIPIATTMTYVFPRFPDVQLGTKTNTPKTGTIAFSSYGFQMHGRGDNKTYDSVTGMNGTPGDGVWSSNAGYTEGASLDSIFSGHAENDGTYHSHGYFRGRNGLSGNQHSTILGYAFDGFPIYGPYGYSSAMDSTSSIQRIATSYQLRSITDRTILPNGSPSIPAGPAIGGIYPLGAYIEDYEYVNGLGDLDEYNGRNCITPDYPFGTYAYFASIDVTESEVVYPYFLADEFYGKVASQNLGSNGEIPLGGTSCLTIGIDESKVMDEIMIYPNPSNGIFNLSGIELKSWVIYDLLGNAVLQGSDDQVDLHSYEKGTYFIKCFTEKGEATKKIVLI